MASCPVCRRQFGSKSALRNHLGNTYEKILPLKCSQCAASFCSLVALTQHVNGSPSHFECDECVFPTSFEQTSQLAWHKEMVHVKHCSKCLIARCHGGDEMCGPCAAEAGSSDVECFGCTRQFGSHSAVVAHLDSGFCPCGMDRITITALAFACPSSGGYTTAKRDKKHQFKCPECNTTFYQLFQLFSHAQDAEGCSDCLGRREPLGRLLRFLETSIPAVVQLYQYFGGSSTKR